MPHLRNRISLFLAFGLLPAWAALFAAPERPNIVLIFSDDQGMGDVSAYGSEIQTPHIDSLARDGIKFQAWYSAASICTPSRFGLLTGQVPNRSQDKMLTALMPGRDDHRGIRAHETTIAEVLRRQGYRTAVIGKWHLGHGEKQFEPQSHGFEYAYGCSHGCVDFFTQNYGDKPDWRRNGELIQENGYTTDLITAEAERFLAAQQAGHPFFLYLPYTAPHYGKGWDPVAKKATNVLQAKPGERERYRAIQDPKRREYAGMVASLDEGVGRVLGALRKHNLEKTTLVLFISDNGGDVDYGASNGSFRGEKSQVFEGGVRVPGILRWPGKIPAGVVTDQPASSLDLFPTFCHLAGADPAGFTLDGVDLVPVLLENRRFVRDLFWQMGGNQGKAFRRGPWKYVGVAGKEMLFNLDNDPHESTDLARTHPDILADLRQRHAQMARGF